RHHEAVRQHAPERRRRVAAAMRPDVRDVLEQMRARNQRKRHAEHFFLAHRGRAERDVHRKHDERDACDQHRMAKDVETAAILDHEYCTLRSMKRNCTTVSATTITISTTDCAPE